MAKAKATESDKPKAETKKNQIKKAELVVEAAPTQPEEAEPKVTAKAGDSPMEPLAKSGKRSAKAQKEAEEKQAKEARKKAAKPSSELSRSVAGATAGEAARKSTAGKPPRSREERAGKKYREAAKLIDKTRVYDLKQALELAVKTATTKFDSTVELHINLGVDPRQADQNVRGTVALPAGTGKNIRVVTLASDADGEKLFAKFDKGEIDFDVLVATPAMMPKLGKYARLLGPRGLMPNPKSGTVTQDVAAAAKEAQAGRVEYRVDQAGIIHLGIGKASFGAEKLQQNATAILDSVRQAKPASLKGIYVKNITISTTMGPGIKVASEAASNQ